MPILKRLLPYYKYLKPVWFKFLLGILFGVLFSLSSGLGLPVMAETVFPILFGNASEAPEWLRLFVERWFGDNVENGFLILCCLALPGVMFLRMVGSVGNGYYMTYSGISVVQAIQIDMFKKVQALPLAFFHNYKTGELNAGVMGYPNQIKSVIVDTSNDLVKQPLTLMSAVGFLVYKSFTSESFFIAIIGVISVPFVVFVIRRVGVYLAKRSRQLVTLGESLGSWVLECFQSPVEIRAYNLQERQVNRFVEYLKSIFRLSMKSTRSSLLVSPSIEVVAGAGLALSLYLGVKNGMNQGEFLALGIALYMAYSPVKRIGAIQNKLKMLEAPLERLEAILYADESVASPANPVSMPQTLSGEITFEGVDFAYLEGNPVLSDINVRIEAGQSVGLVGQSGAGKSTFVNLILRLYDPVKGRILLDGVDLRELDLNELREQIAYVPQMPLLFNASVAENIRIGKPEASEEEILEAARQANALDFIDSLPNGLETVLSERGNSLSGGQRQRIAIARAFLKDAPILVLDEATSALDNQSDRFIQEALTRLAQDRTTLIIAHRLNSLESVERRLYFEKGQIAGDGSHQSLLEESSGYQKLVNADADQRSAG
jgi:ATP-binding cassette, subfamily B, bacterial MsbA